LLFLEFLLSLKVTWSLLFPDLLDRLDPLERLDLCSIDCQLNINLSGISLAETLPSSIFNSSRPVFLLFLDYETLTIPCAASCKIGWAIEGRGVTDLVPIFILSYGLMIAPFIGPIALPRLLSAGI